MNSDVEFHIRQNFPWSKLPGNVKQSLGNSPKEYEKAVFNFSVKNQLRYKGSVVRHVKKDERRYYEDLLKYSRDHLMLYPYHLSDVMVKGLRVTPFAYYTSIMTDIMTQEKSYDSLPNFTAADCLRLLGIGRNQYIDLMNQCRSSKKFFRKKPVRELLPSQPVESVVIEPWWVVQAGYITEDDVKICMIVEKDAIDKVIDCTNMQSGDMDFKVLHSLYRKGLVYLDVSIADDDCIVVPPLEGFVMNRVLGDYFETLLYKIFVSIDEHTTVAELANVLQIDLQLVKNAVSMYCRLGFAKKKGHEINKDDLHPSWINLTQQNIVTKRPTQEQLLIDWTTSINELPPQQNEGSSTPDNASLEGLESTPSLWTGGHSKRIAFLFDSTLTAFLMMGNLSPGLKSHAVTMFEVGKLSDESLDSFLAELEKVDATGEGEAQRYFDHAITLRDTIRFLRYNKDLALDPEFQSTGQGIDLLRCESLLGLEQATCARVLNKNYSLLVSMAPLSNEIRPVSSCIPQHIGPAIPEANSVWFKLFIYQMTGNGPPSLLLVKGTKLRRLPRVLQDYDRLLVTTWGHDPAVIGTSNILLTLNEALSHSAVLVQGHGWRQTEGETVFVPFPLLKEDKPEGSQLDFEQHIAMQRLTSGLDLRHTCGFVTLLKTGRQRAPQRNHPAAAPAAAAAQCVAKSPSAAKFSKNTANTAVSTGASGSLGNSPCNGIKDSMSAEMLASELDSLEERLRGQNANPNSNQNEDAPVEPSGGAHRTNPTTDRSKLTLDLDSNAEGNEVAGGRHGDGGGVGKPDCKHISHKMAVAGGDAALEDHWVLLDCCFGVPLFDAHVNRQVCERIASHGLCNRDSLRELLHSSRKLTLRLLSFIAENQDLPVFQEHCHETGMLPQADKTTDQRVPLPTHNLFFNAGLLQAWSG